MNIGFEAKRVFHNTTGLGNYSRDLVRIMSTFYPENHYFLYNPKQSQKGLFKANGVNVFEKQPKGFFNQLLTNTWRRLGIVQDLKKDQIDLFHGLSGEIPVGLKKNGIRSIVTIHDLIFLRYPEYYSFIDRAIYTRKFKHAAEAADLVVAISEQTKQDIIDFLGIDSKKIKVIYQGCHAAYKQAFSESEKATVLKKYQLPEKFILNVGTIEPRKNAWSIVKAIRDLDIHLVLVGRETAYAKKIRAYLAQEKLEHKVSFLKGLTKEELAIFYQSAQVFVYPSRFEGFGIPIIEALFSKTPVITSRGSCFPEAGGAGSTYIDPDNVEELKQAIEQVLNHPHIAKKMADDGFSYVQKFQDQFIAEEWMKTYKQVLKH
jgi:glycosyltransferase involved in cell wall biosynthesis